jgi:hypothetical protein
MTMTMKAPIATVSTMFQCRKIKATTRISTVVAVVAPPESRQAPEPFRHG